MSTIERARSDIAQLRRGIADLAAWLRRHRVFFPEDQNILPQLEQFAQVGEMVEKLNVVMEQQEKERAQLQGLFQVSGTLNSKLQLDQVLNAAMDSIVQATIAERGFLMLLDDQTHELTYQVARNMDRVTIASPAFEVSRGIAQRVAKSGEAVIATDAMSDPRFADHQSVVSLSLRSILCIPLKIKERVIGVVYVDNRLHAGAFQELELNALRAFADQTAIAIENARLFESLRQKIIEISELKTFQDNIFASIASGVIATDLADRITAFNRAAEIIFGVSAKNTIGVEYQNAELPLALLVDQVKRGDTARAAEEIESDLPARGAVNLSFNISSLKDEAGNSQGVAIVVDDLTEKRRLEATRAMFRRYVAPAVVDRLPANPDQLRLGGKRQTITILFSDIRGFTNFSEAIPPEKLVDILNQYLSAAADAILKQEGTLDKFMGDAVMALFNAPLPQADHALRAARAAIAMRAAVILLHKKLPKELRLNYGIGIHTGDAVVGNVGTEQQMNFTAIGDAVNLAKRLQENASGGQIILSRATYALIREHVHAKEMPQLKVKGRDQVEEVWELEAMRG
ncbi:MAG: GAF domain-containing protein [Chloroflexi bacterium]|nr:GAF domain-containing protein [Chloroflexota bacterium]